MKTCIFHGFGVQGLVILWSTDINNRTLQQVTKFHPARYVNCTERIAHGNSPGAIPKKPQKPWEQYRESDLQYVWRSPLRPLARPCIFFLYIMLSKSYLPRRCDWKEGFSDYLHQVWSIPPKWVPLNDPCIMGEFAWWCKKQGCSHSVSWDAKIPLPNGCWCRLTPNKWACFRIVLFAKCRWKVKQKPTIHNPIEAEGGKNNYV